MADLTKKQYQKPELIYESFELSQSIAGNCEGIAHFAENLCSVTIKSGGFDITIFQSTGIGCVYTPPNPENTVCYHAPSDSNNVFTS